MHEDTTIIEPLLDYWFNQLEPQQRFSKNDDVDSLLRERFKLYVDNALRGHYDSWQDSDATRLAFILLCDQLTRNIYRDTPKAFAGDMLALQASLKAVEHGQVAHEEAHDKRAFLLMPMMHSEAISIHEQALPLFRQYTNEQVAHYAMLHYNIIAKFGRYPHRNHILGRPSSDDELAFLQEPNSSF